MSKCDRAKPYDVGYCQPRGECQFKKGANQSCNSACSLGRKREQGSFTGAMKAAMLKSQAVMAILSGILIEAVKELSQKVRRLEAAP